MVAGRLLVASNCPALCVPGSWVPVPRVPVPRVPDSWVPVPRVPGSWVPATWFCLACTRTVVVGPAAKTWRGVPAGLADEWVNLLAEMSLRVGERLL